MNTCKSLTKELNIIATSNMVEDVQIVDRGLYTLKARIFIKPELFLQIYRNDRFETTNFVLILGRNRIYGRDEIAGAWHRHPVDNPEAHDETEEGRKQTTLLEFWREVQRIIIEMGLK